MNTNTLVIFQVICTDPVTGEADATKLETCRLHHAITEAQGDGVDEVGLCPMGAPRQSAHQRLRRFEQRLWTVRLLLVGHLAVSFR